MSAEQTDVRAGKTGEQLELGNESNKDNSLTNVPPPKPSSSNEKSPLVNEFPGAIAAFESNSCRMCQNVDNSRMVQCDSCDNWYHFECVGVTQEIEYNDWKCCKCANAKAVQMFSSSKRNPARTGKTSKSNTKEKKSTKLTKSSPNQVKRTDKQLRNANRKKKAEGKADKVKPEEKLEEEAKENCSLKQDIKSLVSNSSRKSERAVLALKMKRLEAEQTLLEEEMKRKREMLERKFSLLEDMAEAEERSSTHNSRASVQRSSDAKVRSWLTENDSNNPNDSQSSISGSTSDSENEDGSSTDKYTTTEGEDEVKLFQPPKQSTPVGSQNFSKNRYHQSAKRRTSLTRKQIAARQVVPRDLPKFAGNPEEWPMFLSTFESTSKMCGYTDEENMIRLRSCLRDEAFNTVRSLLMMPSTVPKAISTLKLRFGQPQIIINTLRAKVLGMPPIKPDAMDKLIDHALAVQNLCSTIDACGRKEYKRDVTLLNEIIGKLPSSLKLEWARYQRKTAKVNLFVYSEWIYDIAEDACLVCGLQGGDKYVDSRSKSKGKAFLNTHSDYSPLETAKQYPPESQKPGHSREMTLADTSKCCLICKGSCKNAGKCPRFQGLSYDARWDAVREFRICRRCLRQHGGRCDAKPCGKNGCTFKHHQLLHKELVVVTESADRKSSMKEETNVNTHLSSSGVRMFRYLPVTLYGATKQVECYAFLDDGSELTLIDQNLAEDLEVDGKPKPLFSGHSGRKFVLDDVRTVEDLQLPVQSLDVDILKKSYPYLCDIPVASYKNVRPRILIGLKHARITLVRRSREGKIGEPIAVKTHLGWTIYGSSNLPDPDGTAHRIYHICECNHSSDDSLQRLHRAVKSFFSLESLGIYKPEKIQPSTDEERSQRLLQTLTCRVLGQYETGLLWRYDEIRLPDSKPMALSRLRCLEKRLDRDPELTRVLREKMADYIAKDYVRKLTAEELEEKQQRVWYLPIFPVINPNKPGKVRIVWDAAASVHGVSLNSVLLTGPDELTSLPAVLCQFREYRIAICGDIREMFHQVRIRSEDQHCQRFLWRENPEQEPSTYIMKVMTFGACCSPSTAQFVKNRNAERFQEQYPAAVDAIIRKHYVDDMLASEESEEAAIELAMAVRLIHAEGGFEIRNWLSNSQRVTAALRGETAVHKDLDLATELATEKVLGMWWDTSNDRLTFKVSWTRFDEALLMGTRRPTKNEVLRVLMTIFDPLGLISNYLMQLKITLQEVWRSGVQWGELIKDKQFEAWKNWVTLLPSLERISIPRCFRKQTTASKSTVIQLHVFVDASENGMAAAAYLRFQDTKNIECTLLCAKTRVAPLKFLSIPRLELTAAVIGTRLVNSLVTELSLEISKRFYWTDSRNVLCWLQSDHRRYSPFVAARISEILETTEVSEWRWVPTKLNVADDGTKWQRRPDMSPNSRWFNGPKYLQLSEEFWPPIVHKNSVTDEELRPSVLLHHQVSSPMISASNFSSWKRLLRVTGYVIRFVTNLQLRVRRKDLITGSLSSEELQQAEKYHFKSAQFDVSPDEVTLLQIDRQQSESSKSISKSSAVYKLCPFLDTHGVMRMKGRVDACEFLLEDAKNPIILPRLHPVTRLILAYYHEKFHHQNHRTVLNEVRQRFYVPRLRALLTKTRSSCQRCKIRDAVANPPAMADLPPARLAAFTRPFAHTGIDYFGPIEVVLGRRVEKRWGVLLTCLTIRAVHLEIAHSLTTDSCILALRNFIVRRGVPVSFYSDRGTNFIGADRVLQEALQVVNQERLMQEFTSAQTSWHFNPPVSPHMGGSWERLIQTVKRNLGEIVGGRRPTDEELKNALIEIEGVLNTRPLTHVPVDAESAAALTPNHFLLGSSDGSKPLTLYSENVAVLRHGWELSQVIANRFWKRWLRDYLPEITRRTKWYQKTKPIEVGDIVIIADPDHPRNCWPQGRVIGVTNRDGQVRRATVQTVKGVYERPAVKLAVLDVRSKAE
ncbi:uncharacterized protein LOC131428813 [Malaya genurostris]|uniref:uncharacterized protein LOC131428813 n=1 Tax=Malaya genurostris TaxID=325434 RepID=UPI0026F3FC31|nr:uncharacterized protein LOC131428813 [Malaya genurostris]